MHDEDTYSTEITAIFRARQVLQPFDFPATPTMAYRCANSAKGEGIESSTVPRCIYRYQDFRLSSVVDCTQQKGKRRVGTAQVSPVRHQHHPAFIVDIDINGEAEYNSKSKTKT